jgi:hypothetical protein
MITFSYFIINSPHSSIFFRDLLPHKVQFLTVTGTKVFPTLNYIQSFCSVGITEGRTLKIIKVGCSMKICQ